MSRRSKRKQKTIERATMPAGGNIISPAVIQAMLAQQGRPSKVASNEAYFSPGKPLETQQGANPKGLPRLWQYPIAANTFAPDRTMGNQDIPAFQQLRNLATLCDGVALCEKVWLDLIPKLTIKIQLRKDLEEAGAKLSSYQKEISAYSKFFEKPDGVNDFHSWLRMAVVEQTQIDALYIYKQRDRAGRLLKLPIIAGDTMKPLLDDWGAIVAFQQFPWGIPGEVYTSDEMIYFRESPQANTPYGRSRVERVLVRVNQALRKAKKDLSYFTEGNQPFSIMEVPEASNWTPDQIDAYEQMWNALIAGSAQQQVRVKFTQPGMKYTPLEQYQLQCEFDKFLLNFFAADYGLSMADLSFTESIHKSADEGQQNMLFRRTLFPLTVMYSMICTGVIRDEFHDDRFIFGFGGYEETEDLQMLSTAYGGFIDRGVISPSDVAHAMHFPDIPQTGPYIITKTGPMFLEDFADPKIRAAQKQAQLAGLQLAAHPEQNQPNEEEGQEDGEDTQQQQAQKGKQSASPRTQQPKEERVAMAGTGSEDDTATRYVATEEARMDYKRWRGRALDDIRSGKAIRPFTSSFIPVPEHTRISEALACCTTDDDVRYVFKRAQEMKLEHWQDANAPTQRFLNNLKEQGVQTLTWRAKSLTACSECAANDGQTVAIGKRFKSGAYLIPNHNHCNCWIEDSLGQQYAWAGADGEYKLLERMEV